MPGTNRTDRTGTPVPLTDRTLERLDPEAFAATAVAHHPTGWAGGFEGSGRAAKMAG